MQKPQQQSTYTDSVFFSVIQKIINIFHYFIIIIDEDHNILLANDPVLNSLGKKLEDITGCFCPKIIHGTDEPFPGCPLEEALKTGSIIEKKLFDPFYKKWVSSAIYPMNYHTKDGKKIFFHIAIDISDQIIAEETIINQNKFLNNILESLTQPFYVIDVNDYSIVMANSAANSENLTKNTKCYQISHNKNKPCNSIDHPCTIDEIKRTKKPIIVEHKHHTKDGQIRQYEVHGYPIFDEDMNLKQIIEYNIDITKRKRAEARLKKIQKELEIKSKNLEDNNIALKVLLDHRDKEKIDMNKNIIGNIKTLVYPFLDKLKHTSLTESQKTLLNILESNLSEIIKPFSIILMDESINLSPAEVRIANLIKEGKTAKEIALIINISVNTAKAHYRNIRSKLKIKNKKINLRSYLQSLKELSMYKKS
ncbi:MAG: PAS domain-containing protein [Candidatus Latescibacteria bacterium]|nr:PAS domain-containing protein [Candidatus Latescibacterota bacterium]